MPHDEIPHEADMTNPVHIIGEAGTNHNGQADEARSLVDIAAHAAVDSVKFQIIYPEGLYLPQLRQGEMLVDNEVFEQRRQAQLADDDYRRLADYCRDQGMPFGASVFDDRGVALLDELDAAYIKIASCDLNNSRLITRAAETGRRVVLSTGMSLLGEVEAAVSAFLSTGAQDLVLMHCVSIYPCPTDEANVGFVGVLASSFGLPVGFSDHTETSTAAAIAVALGATWLEKHFTRSRDQIGFDHAYAMEPSGLESYVADVRSAERACSRRSTKVGAVEASVRARARRGLHAARDLKVGDTLSEDDVLVVRPEGELGPNDLDTVVGLTVAQPVSRFAPLSIATFCAGE